MASIRLLLNGKSSGDQRVRPGVTKIRERGHQVSVRVTWEAADMRRLIDEALEDADKGGVDTIVSLCEASLGPISGLLIYGTAGAPF
jgi:diacylglycerol kinase family enzyme